MTLATAAPVRAPKEHGLLMTGPLVLQTMRDQKTETRRLDQIGDAIVRLRIARKVADVSFLEGGRAIWLAIESGGNWRDYIKHRHRGHTLAEENIVDHVRGGPIDYWARAVGENEAVPEDWAGSLPYSDDPNSKERTVGELVKEIKERAEIERRQGRLL